MLEGKLINIKDDMGIIHIPKYDLTVKYPIEELSDLLEIGDTVNLSVSFPEEGKKIEEYMHSQQKEKEYENIRTMLEDLVN